MSETKKEVTIDFRDLNVMYNVEYKTVAEIAAHYGIEWVDAKQALRDFGITVRINEPKAAEPERPYIVTLTDKMNLKQKRAKTVVATPVAQTGVTTAQ